nr:cell-envelope stress modulator CpxP [Biostraticola tofi]
MVSVNALADENNITKSWHYDDVALRASDGQYGMFEGVKLSERQRQQMRDLMSQARHEMPLVNVSEIEQLHTLITAETFDEAAVRSQTEKMAQQQVARQVEMARVRNQMYNLLTPEQRQILNQRHAQRIDEMKLQLSEMSPASAQKPIVNE